MLNPSHLCQYAGILAAACGMRRDRVADQDSGGRANPSSFLTVRKAASLTALTRYLRQEDIRLDVAVFSQPELFDDIGRHMEQEHALPRESVASGLARREQLASTGLGQGVAIPHTRVLDLDRIVASYLRLKTPILFNAPDSKPVVDILVLLVPKQASEEHLRILADVSGMFSDDQFRARLRQCGDSLAVKQLFDAWPLPSS